MKNFKLEQIKGTAMQNTKYKIAIASLALGLGVSVGLNIFQNQSAHGTYSSYKYQSEQLESAQTAQANQFFLLTQLHETATKQFDDAVALRDKTDQKEIKRMFSEVGEPVK